MITFEGYKGRFYRLRLRIINLTTKDHIFICKGSKISNNTVVETGTRINGPIIIKGSGKCTIGKYGALGDNIKIVTSNHNSKVINLQYALSKRIGISNAVDPNKDVVLGHNVWIGDSTIILPGVTIGNGAVIGAGSVVTKNIDPYSVAAGVPAKHKKYRFTEEKIKEIENTKWWNWSLSNMKKNIDFFKSN